MRKDRDETRRLILRGLRDGFPIGLGYFAVAFSLGITARGAGVSPLQGWIASILNHASAGEYALYSLIAANAAYWEVAAVIFVTNMRYLLMSAALSQKMPQEAGFLRRLMTGFCITDEIFGLGIAWPGTLSCLYLGTAFVLADVMWATGTTAGILAGSILPAEVVTALSVAIYGMFLAVIIPPARTERSLAWVIVIAAVISCLFYYLPMLSQLSSGWVIIICAVAASSFAALKWPVKEEEEA